MDAPWLVEEFGSSRLGGGGNRDTRSFAACGGHNDVSWNGWASPSCETAAAVPWDSITSGCIASGESGRLDLIRVLAVLGFNDCWIPCCGMIGRASGRASGCLLVEIWVVAVT